MVSNHEIQANFPGICGRLKFPYPIITCEDKAHPLSLAVLNHAFMDPVPILHPGWNANADIRSQPVEDRRRTYPIYVIIPDDLNFTMYLDMGQYQGNRYLHISHEEWILQGRILVPEVLRLLRLHSVCDNLGQQGVHVEPLSQSLIFSIPQNPVFFHINLHSGALATGRILPPVRFVTLRHKSHTPQENVRSGFLQT